MLLAGRFIIPFRGRTQSGFLCADPQLFGAACWGSYPEGELSARTNAIVGGLRGLQVLSVGAV